MDLKIGGIVAAAAFTLSFLIGLISQSTMPFLIIWPLVFAAVFFVILNAAKFLFSQFLPELLDESQSGSLPGAVVNIMEGDTNIDEFSSDADQESDGAFSTQVPNAAANAARPDDSDKSIEDISTLSEVVARNRAAYGEGASADVSRGIDQNMENGYTLMGDLEKNFQPAPPLEVLSSKAEGKPKARTSARSGSPAWLSASDDTLPDLDSMAGVFTNVSTGEEQEAADNSVPSRSRRKSANRDQSLDGDFSPKDIAEGIRTVLKKDKEE